MIWGLTYDNRRNMATAVVRRIKSGGIVLLETPKIVPCENGQKTMKIADSFMSKFFEAYYFVRLMKSLGKDPKEVLKGNLKELT